MFIFSGYVSRMDWWEQFSEDWQVLLDESPRLPYFKMREAVKGFGGIMKQGAANVRICKFLELMKLAVHVSISCVIPVALYNRVVKGKVHAEWDDPYFLAIFDVIMKFIDPGHLEGPDGDVVEFVFDDNPRLAARVPQWYQLTRSLLHDKDRERIGVSPKFENDIKFLPLQAGDAQSWYFRRLFAEKITGEPFPRGVPKDLFKTLDDIPSLVSLWNAERLGNLACGLAQPYVAQHQRYRNIHDLIDSETFS